MAEPEAVEVYRIEQGKWTYRVRNDDDTYTDVTQEEFGHGKAVHKAQDKADELGVPVENVS